MSRFRKTGHLLTEKVNSSTLDIDTCSPSEIVETMIAEDRIITEAVLSQKENISRAVEMIKDSLKNKGRLFFVGAGTSGRLGVLEAAECPPTFGTDPEMIQGIIAGGSEAMIRSVEGAEDTDEDAAEKLKEADLNERDVVVGIAASLSTPFVIGALKYAGKIGSRTVLITCNPVSEPVSDVAIVLLVGPEVIVGSTRLKSATATKMVLNMLTTTSMVLLGKTYGNLMVDVQPSSSKLKDRAVRIVMEICRVERSEAIKLLENSGWSVKSAVLMYKRNVSFEESLRILKNSRGFLKKALVS